VVPFTPTVATFNILMKARGTDLYRPKYLMDEMKTFGLSPSGISWSVLVGLYGSSQNTKGSIEVSLINYRYRASFSTKFMDCFCLYILWTLHVQIPISKIFELQQGVLIKDSFCS